MVGVPIGTDKYVLDRAMEVVRDGGADRLARCLQAGGGPYRHRIARAEDKLLGKGSRHWSIPRSMQKGRQRGAVRVRKHPGATRSGGGTVIFPRGVPR